MRYIIYGAGAIGGVIGGMLHAAGLQTVLICRGAHLEAIRARGLTLRQPDGERQLMVPVAGHPRELTFAEGDVVVLTMKSLDTTVALADLEAAGGADLPIVCCQNGVANERMASRRFEHVYAMLVNMPATFMEAGIVLGFARPVAGVLDAGCYPSGTDALISLLATDFTGAGLLCRADPAVMRLKYAKLLTNLSNAVNALAGERPADERGRELMRHVRQEALDCYKAAGIDAAGAEEYHARVNSHLDRIGNVGGQRGGSSTWQSLMKGHERLETDYLNGEIMLLGRLHGVPTPYNAALRRLSQQLAASGGSPGAYTLEDIEELAGRLAGTAESVRPGR